MPKLTHAIVMLIFAVTGCSTLPPSQATATTRNFSAPTLAPTSEIIIRNSQELYGDTTPFGGVGQNSIAAAALPNEAALPPLLSGTREPSGAESVQLLLDSGEVIIGDLYEQISPESRVAGVLIIGRDRLSWGLLPVELFGAGFTVLVLELPQTVRVTDLDALLTSFSEAATVDPSRIAVIGAEGSADMALLACATFAICDAVVMLTPQGRDTLLNVLPNFSPRPVFVSAAQNDTEGYPIAVAIASQFAEGSQFVEVAAGRGTSLLALNSDLSRTIATWLRGVFS
ncbi:MAG: hypothetical protein Q9P44_22005 [Anaerolineae bacterium]|nr:hypothetical protein [Anaerolineae bacterium]